MTYKGWIALGTVLNLIIISGLLYSLWWLGMLLVSWVTSGDPFSAWGQPWIGMLVIVVSGVQTYITAGAYAASPNHFKLTTVVLVIAPVIIILTLIAVNIVSFLNS